jgi:tetratricopeptide (TPR) repeat protein
MKALTIYLLLFFYAITACSQTFPDSVWTKYKSYGTQKEKQKFLADYLQNVLYFDKKGIEKGIELSSLFKKQNEESAADLTTIIVAMKLAQDEGNYTAGLNMALPVLQRFEQKNDSIGVTFSLAGIATCYHYSQDYEQAIAYNKKAIPLIISMGNESLITRLYNDIGSYYESASMPDSGLVYAHKALELATKLKYEQGMPYVLSTVAENYIANKDYDLAQPFLRRAIDYATKLSNDRALGFLNNDFAQIFVETEQYDSAFYYLNNAIKSYNTQDSKPQQLRSYKYLSQCFEETNQIDSANKYFRLTMAIKDTLYNMEKAKLVHSMSFTEQLRQQEIEESEARAVEERQHNIQFALIAIGIISFVILFLLLSRSIITNTRVIAFLSILALLVVFEFLNLLLHPFLERVTHHSPLLMLLALVCIAALLIPLHHKLEKWTTHKLVEKNKAVRLANAKKTIEQLEKDN